MIKYRPHRGGLSDSMKEQHNFKNIRTMLEYIEKNWNGLIETGDIVIGASLGTDNRTGWKSTRYVCTIRCGEDHYKTPQCIGMCDLGEKG